MAAVTAITNAATFYTLEKEDHEPVARALTASTGWKCTLTELESAQLRDFHCLATVDGGALSNRRISGGALSSFFLRFPLPPMPKLPLLSFLNHSAEGQCTNNMVVLCHYAEGRVLLTDQDGLYNSFIDEAVRATSGNVFVVLTGVPTSAAVLADDEAVADLVEDGGQQSVSALKAAGRFITCDSLPSELQIAQLKQGLEGSLPPLETPPGVAERAAKARSGRRRGGSGSGGSGGGGGGGGFLCQIL